MIEDNRAREQAISQLDSIKEMMYDLKKAEEIGDETLVEDNKTVIQDSVLSAAPVKNYEILLSTGGPACRIIGELDCNNDPKTAELQYQDWGIPWTDYVTTNSPDAEALLDFACQFYFDY